MVTTRCACGTAQQFLPQLLKGCRASCQAFDNLDALHLFDTVRFISHAAL